MSTTDPIRVQGLREFVRNLKTLDKDLPKMVRKAFNAAADLVVEDTVPHVPKRSGRAAKSIRAASTQTKARVRGGGSRAPYYPWLDFGGRVGPRRSVHRPFYKQGRYLYAEYGDLRDAGRFQDEMVKAMLAVVEAAGIDMEA